MRFLTTLAVVATALAIGATGAAARPDYQPLLRPAAQPDGYQPQLRESGAARSAAAALHPDSRAVRPGVVAETAPMTEDGGLGFSWASGVIGALGAWIVAVLAVVAASAMRERRRLVLR